MTDQLAPVVRTAEVGLSPNQAFGVFTEQMGAWWPLRTHGVFGERSGGVRFVDGRLVETAIDGDEAVWAEVLSWEPPKGFAMAWHPGRPDGPAGRVEVSFEAVESVQAGEVTRVEIRHDGWEAFGRDGLAMRRSYAGPSAWGSVLDHFSDGTEPYPMSAEAEIPPLTELAEVYERFFAEAERGGFGPPPDGDGPVDAWNAEQVVAHVALNDLAMITVAHAIVHRGEPAFENQTAQDPVNLARVIDRCGDMAGLIAFGRWCAANAVAAVGRLNTEQQMAPVECRLTHDGNIMLDEPRPWAPLAVAVQAGMHLPAHIAQLQDLRPTAE
jgi:hypothetical protein